MKPRVSICLREIISIKHVYSWLNGIFQVFDLGQLKPCPPRTQSHTYLVCPSVIVIFLTWATGNLWTVRIRQNVHFLIVKSSNFVFLSYGNKNMFNYSDWNWKLPRNWFELKNQGLRRRNLWPECESMGIHYQFKLWRIKQLVFCLPCFRVFFCFLPGSNIHLEIVDWRFIMHSQSSLHSKMLVYFLGYSWNKWIPKWDEH